MNPKTRRKLEMGARALKFSRAHPDPSPGYTASVTDLEESLARAIRLVALQREGDPEAPGAVLRKRDQGGTMRRAQLAHLIRETRTTSRDLPELRQKFNLRRRAPSMMAEARTPVRVIVVHPAQAGASAGLDEVADEMVQIVRAMDRLNRLRFANRPDLLAAWKSVSSVMAPARISTVPGPEEPSPGPDDLPPAA